MKTNKISKRMLLGTLAVISLLLVTGYTFVIAQSEDDIDINLLSEVRTANAIGETTVIEVTYLKQENPQVMYQISQDNSGGDYETNGLYSWMFLTCQGQWTCSGSPGLTC